MGREKNKQKPAAKTLQDILKTNPIIPKSEFDVGLPLFDGLEEEYAKYLGASHLSSAEQKQLFEQAYRNSIDIGLIDESSGKFIQPSKNPQLIKNDLYRIDYDKNGNRFLDSNGNPEYRLVESSGKGVRSDVRGFDINGRRGGGNVTTSVGDYDWLHDQYKSSLQAPPEPTVEANKAVQQPKSQPTPIPPEEGTVTAQPKVEANNAVNPKPISEPATGPEIPKVESNKAVISAEEGTTAAENPSAVADAAKQESAKVPKKKWSFITNSKDLGDVKVDKGAVSDAISKLPENQRLHIESNKPLNWGKGAKMLLGGAVLGTVLYNMMSNGGHQSNQELFGQRPVH